MGTDGACSPLICAAKWNGAFLPNTPAGLRARVSRLGGLRGRSPGNYFPQLGPQLFAITGEAVTSRSRSSSILMG